MRQRVKRTRRIQYPASGVQSDVEALLQKFVETKSIRYEVFARLWRDGNYSLIHAGRNGLRENREFMEETFKIVLKFILPPYSLQVRVGAIYVLYSFYHTQRAKMKIKARVPLSCWRDVMDLHEQVITHRHLDVDYIIRKMIHDGVFEHVAYPSPLTIDDFYNDEDGDEEEFVEESDKNWQKDVNLIHKLLDEDSLGQLNAVHNKYHQLKCQLHASLGGDPNTPSSSLDLIQSDVVGTIVQVAQIPEISVTSPQKRKGKSARRKVVEASSEESASERATRISEIKKRAQSSRVNTDSGSLRYLNTSPDPAVESTENKPRQQDGAKAKTPKENKKYKKKELPPVESDSDSEDLSEDDIIKGVISSIAESSNVKSKPGKRVPTRKAKQRAHSKLKHIGSDSDDNDDSYDDDDDDFDIQKECSGLRAGNRSARKALQRSRLARSSLDENRGGHGNEINKTSARKSTLAASAQKRKRSPDQSHSSDQSRDQSSSKKKMTRRSSSPSSSDSSLGKVSGMYKTAKRPKSSTSSAISVPTDEESVNIEVELDKFVALKPFGDEKERPLLGKVVTVTKNFVNIIWYTGGYSSKWGESLVGEGDDKKIRGEKVSRRHVLMAGIELTSTGKLPVKVMKDLRKMYPQLDEQGQRRMP